MGFVEIIYLLQKVSLLVALKSGMVCFLVLVDLKIIKLEVGGKSRL